MNSREFDLTDKDVAEILELVNELLSMYQNRRNQDGFSLLAGYEDTIKKIVNLKNDEFMKNYKTKIVFEEKKEE